MSQTLEELAQSVRHLTAAIPRETPLPRALTANYRSKPRGPYKKRVKAAPVPISKLKLRLGGLEAMARSARHRATVIRTKLELLHAKGLALDGLVEHLDRELKQLRADAEASS